jgi:ribosomal-protein-serine acetyltransferase
VTDQPVLLDFPDAFETERLLIRAPREGDAPALTEAVNASLDHLRPWMPWAQEPATVEKYTANIRRGIARWVMREDLWLMLIRKADGYWLGSSGLHRIDWSVPRFEIGYWVRADAEGKGYVTEAVSGITDFAFGTLKAERVEIRCDSLNVRSAAVAERCGYALEGRLRNDSRSINGDLRDTLIYSTIRPEWAARQG